MRTRLGLGLLLMAGMSFACAERALSPDRAASLIADLDAFKRDAHFRIRTDVPFQSAFECLSQSAVERAPLNQFVVSRGWARYETRQAILGFGKKESCPSLALTPNGEAASANWTRGNGGPAGGTAWTIPIARRELLGAPRLTPVGDDSTQVEFDWKWTPNEVGTALRESIPEAASFSTKAGKGAHRASDPMAAGDAS
jgi:hypothetical protein